MKEAKSLHRKICYSGLSIILLFFLSGNAVLAGEKRGPALQDTDNCIELQEIVVTSTRTQKNKDTAPNSVSVVSKQEIEKKHINTLDEALKYETGVYVGRFGGILDSTPDVTMRGLPGDDRTLVLLNGLPLNQGYTGSVDWAALSMENIERVEVIRGPGSALYGGNAMGGVVNIITNTPEKFVGKVKAGYGSNGKKRGSIYIGGRFRDRLSLSGGFEKEELNDADPTDLVIADLEDAPGGDLHGGYPGKNPDGDIWWVAGDGGEKQAERWNANFQAACDLVGNGKVFFDFQKGHRHYDYDEPNTYLAAAAGDEAFEGIVNTGSGLSTEKIDPSDYLSGKGQTEFSNYALRYKDLWENLSLDFKAGFQDRDHWYTSADEGCYQNATGDRSDSESSSWFADIQADYFLTDSHLLTGGLYFRNDDYQSDVYDLSYYRDEDSKIEKTGITRGKNRFYAVYVQDEWRILDELALYAGLRFDYWECFDGKSGKLGEVADFEDMDDSSLSPALSVNWHPLSDTYIRGSVARGFRAPNIYELYRTWSWGGWLVYHSNPGLEPETLWNYELGTDQYFFGRKLKLFATVFYTDVDDYIDTYKGEGPNYYDYYRGNIAEVEINGLELGGTAYPFAWLKIWANHTLNDAEYKESEEKPEIEGNKVTDVPDRIINLGTEINHKGFTASLNGRYLGRVYTDEENLNEPDVYTEHTDDFWLWDAKVALSPREHWDLSLSVQNIFDKKYYKYYIGRDRRYFCEVSFKW
ncbi:MAG: TonB-dependent receptor [Desulfobia sp.]